MWKSGGVLEPVCLRLEPPPRLAMLSLRANNIQKAVVVREPLHDKQVFLRYVAKPLYASHVSDRITQFIMETTMVAEHCPATHNPLNDRFQMLQLRQHSSLRGLHITDQHSDRE